MSSSSTTPRGEAGDSLPVGFSERIHDPAFSEFKSESSRASMIFTLALGAIALVGMPIYGAMSGDLTWPTSLYYGAGIAGLFVGIAVIGDLKRRRDYTWDGVVADKRTREITRFDANSESSDVSTIFEIRVQRDGDGKMFKHAEENDPSLFAYFDVGDKVRHHKGFSHYEKYDKTNPGVLLCISCGAINDRVFDECGRCKCPLLK